MRTVWGVRGRFAAALVAALTVVGASASFVAVTATPAGAIDVTTEAEYRDAFGALGDVEINLLNDIEFPCPTFASRASGGTVTVHGNGHTITGCATTLNHSVAGGNLVLDNVVLSGGSFLIAVAAGDVTLTDSHLMADNPASTVGIAVTAGDLHLTRSQVGPLEAPTATGISVAGGSVTLDGSQVGPITADLALGISVASADPLSLTDSQVISIHADGGASLTAAVDSVSLVRSTIADGIASSIAAGTVEIVNSTISNNDGPLTMSFESGSIVYSDIVENTALIAPGEVPELPALPDDAPAGLTLPELVVPDVAVAQVPAQLVWSGELSFFGTVVALPVGGVANCDPVGTTPISNGYNFSDDDSCGFTESTDREDAGDPMLGALGDNGGPTLTRLPLTGSPLVNAIPEVACQDDGAAGITTDQRGLPRPAEGACEIGSVELQPPPLPVPLVLEPTFTG